MEERTGMVYLAKISGVNRAIQKPTNEVNEEEKLVKQLNFVAIVHICDVTTGTFPFIFK